MDRFESDLCTYLNAHANGDLRDAEKITQRWATDKSIGHIALLLATLAAGAHYSDVEYPQRLELSTDFGKFAFPGLLLKLTISSPVISCSSPGKFSLSPVIGHNSGTFDTREYITKYGPVGCGLGVVRHDHSVGTDHGASYRAQHRALA
jgi:hypothetical protein